MLYYSDSVLTNLTSVNITPEATTDQCVQAFNFQGLHLIRYFTYENSGELKHFIMLYQLHYNTGSLSRWHGLGMQEGFPKKQFLVIYSQCTITVCPPPSALLYGPPCMWDPAAVFTIESLTTFTPPRACKCDTTTTDYAQWLKCTSIDYLFQYLQRELP